MLHDIFSYFLCVRLVIIGGWQGQESNYTWILKAFNKMMDNENINTFYKSHSSSVEEA
jgi:hypothetical protein